MAVTAGCVLDYCNADYVRSYISSNTYNSYKFVKIDSTHITKYLYTDLQCQSQKTVFSANSDIPMNTCYSDSDLYFLYITNYNPDDGTESTTDKSTAITSDANILHSSLSVIALTTVVALLISVIA